MTNSTAKMMSAIHSDPAKAEEILYRANAYREFKDDIVGYMEAHEYNLSDGNVAFKVSRECYKHIASIVGYAAVDFILDNAL